MSVLSLRQIVSIFLLQAATALDAQQSRCLRRQALKQSSRRGPAGKNWSQESWHCSGEHASRWRGFGRTPASGMVTPGTSFAWLVSGVELARDGATDAATDAATMSVAAAMSVKNGKRALLPDRIVMMDPIAPVSAAAF
jgi:hypothetical protein